MNNCITDLYGFYFQWNSYKDWFDATAFQGLRQILVETHRLVGNSTHEFFQYLHNLGYVMFHKVCNRYWWEVAREHARNLTVVNFNRSQTFNTVGEAQLSLVFYT